MVESKASKVDEIVEARGNSYGHPYENFHNIARFWNGYLDARFGFEKMGASITREDVGFMMELFKIARGVNDKSENTLDDIEGYNKCIRMIRERASLLNREN